MERAHSRELSFERWNEKGSLFLFSQKRCDNLSSEEALCLPWKKSAVDSLTLPCRFKDTCGRGLAFTLNVQVPVHPRCRLMEDAPTLLTLHEILQEVAAAGSDACLVDVDVPLLLHRQLIRLRLHKLLTDKAMELHRKGVTAFPLPLKPYLFPQRKKYVSHSGSSSGSGMKGRDGGPVIGEQEAGGSNEDQAVPAHGAGHDERKAEAVGAPTAETRSAEVGEGMHLLFTPGQAGCGGETESEGEERRRQADDPRQTLNGDPEGSAASSGDQGGDGGEKKSVGCSPEGVDADGEAEGEEKDSERVAAWYHETFRNCQVQASQDAYDDLCELVSSDVLRSFVHALLQNKDELFVFRKRFTQSVGLLGLLNYILSMADINPSKLLLSTETGLLSQLELKPSYNASTLSLDFVERVPFRLTRNIESLVGPFGRLGVLPGVMLSLVRCLRKHQDHLASSLCLFIRDDITALHGQRRQNAGSPTDGRGHGKKTGVSSLAQVQALKEITEANVRRILDAVGRIEGTANAAAEATKAGGALGGAAPPGAERVRK